MISRSFEQIKKVILDKGYKLFENGNYNINIIAVRENDVFENTFSDTLYLLYKVAGIWKVKTYKFTTLAGTKGFGGEKNPLTKAQTGTANDGVAIIKEGQYLGAFEYTVNPSGNYPFQKYLKQVVPFTYYRDNDRNGVITRTSPQETRNNQTHFHVMSNYGDIDYINTDYVAYSQGCVGTNHHYFFNIEIGIMPILERGVKLFGTKFSFTMLHGSDFDK